MAVTSFRAQEAFNLEVFEGDELAEVLEAVADWSRSGSDDTIEDIVVSFDTDANIWTVAIYWIEA